MRSIRFGGAASIPICLLLLLAGGCSDNTAGKADGSVTCTGSDDCPFGQVCHDGICQDPGGDDDPQTCTTSADCPVGQECENGTCQDQADGGDGSDGDGGDDTIEEPDLEIVEPPAAGDPLAYLLDFGSVVVGEPVFRTVRLRNVGQADLRIVDLAFEMGTVDDFYLEDTLVQALPIVLGPEEETSLDVFYLASDGINDYGVLSIISNDPDEARVTIQLESTFKGTADIQVEPASLAFGDVLQGNQARLNLTVSNQGTGNAVLTVEGIQLASLVGDQYELADLPPFPLYLNRGDGVDIGVLYHPTSLEDHVDRVVIVSSDENDPQMEVDINGRGVKPNLLAEPSPIDFDELRVGESLPVTVSLSNIGGAPLSITGLTISSSSTEFQLSSDPADGFDLSILSEAEPQVLQPEETRFITVTYSPVDEGPDEATLLLDSPDLEPNPMEIAISGLGYLPPVIEVVPSSLDFSELHIRDSETLSLTVRNVGQRFLSVSEISVDGVLDSFSVVPSLLPNLGPMDEAQVDVTFMPMFTGTHQASLNLVSNDPVNPTTVVPLAGQAIDPTIFVIPMPPIAFGDVYQGQLVEQDITVFNFGVGNLTVDSVELAVPNTDFSLVDAPSAPVELAPNTDSLVFTLVYAPQEIGPDANVVRVVSNDLDNPNLPIQASGNGVDCPVGHWDIDGDPANGCEYVCVLTHNGIEACDLVDNDCDGGTDEDFILESDPAHCGQCNNECSYLNAQGVCSTSTCSMGVCNPNFWDADDDDSNGCEYPCVLNSSTNGVEICNYVDDDCDNETDEDFITSSDVQNCGACGNICDLYQASPVCIDSQCEIDSCLPNFEDCDTDPVNGCEVSLLEDPDNCNQCNNICSFPNAPALCVAGVCTPGTCGTNFDDCDGDLTNGCETNILTSHDHCGACYSSCSDVNEECVDGLCKCGTIGDDCTLSETCCGIDCVDTNDDVDNCGGCGNECDPNELCTLSECKCGGDGDDCTSNQICCGSSCYDPLTSTEHCGACDVQCDANELCTVDGCRCGGGSLDCNAPMTCCGQACVDTQSDESHCGICDNACDTANTNETCSSGSCTFVSCHSGFGDCDAGVDGCETDIENDVDHCGGCAQPCTNQHGGQACLSGICNPSCDSLWGDCDSDPDNGCEQDLTDMNHCSACNTQCFLPNATAVCDSGSCLIDFCDTGWTDCNGQANDGCEIFTAGDEDNCGSCGNTCTNANGGTVCADGSCTPTCDPGWGNCNGDPDDGCETYTDGNLSHCGACSNACTNPNGSTSCVSGACTPVCDPGWADCDMDPDNGCETDIWQDSSCGSGCTGTRDCSAVIQNGLGANCSAGSCDYTTCVAGYGDCDTDRTNGCEENLNTADDHCGDCSTVCQDVNSSNQCTSGLCIPVCAAGWGDCDSQPEDGCETNLNTSDSNCGGCGTICQDVNGSNICTGGSCVPSCSSGYGNCNGDAPDGCETNLNSSDTNCGGCGTICQDINGNNSCVAGACVPSCTLGFGDCDGDPSDGCETNLDTSDSNCGGCGTTCEDINGSNVCTSGNCIPSCDSGFGNCDGDDPDGCETDLNTSDANCGGCGTVCQDINGTNSCISGTCIPSCSSDWGNCDGDPNDGCETNLNTSDANCGGCGTICEDINSTNLCSSGTCLPSCDSGWGNCDSDPADGCETNLNTSDTNCGGCGTICVDQNGSNSCVSGTCTPVCTSGFADCDGNPNNGCETNLNTDDLNCGSCTTVCQEQNGTNSCSSGTCSPTCFSGYGDCDSNPNNGCEVNTNNNDNNCGGCGTVCQDINANNSCNGSGVCNPTCNSGWASCDLDPNDGCETFTNGDDNNCGSCGNVCEDFNSDNSCDTGVCDPTCDTGYQDCSDPADGCEIYTDGDLNNCGGCDVTCSRANATPQCTLGACSISSCHADYWSADEDDLNGCECADLADPTVGSACSAPTDVPTISSTHTLELRNGVLVYWEVDSNPIRNDRDCWKVPFESPNPGSGTFRIRFTNSEPSLRFDVYRNNCSTLACGGTGDNTFESDCLSTASAICQDGNNNDWIVCVRVAAGFDNVCEPYQLRFEYY